MCVCFITGMLCALDWTIVTNCCSYGCVLAGFFGFIEFTCNERRTVMLMSVFSSRYKIW